MSTLAHKTPNLQSYKAGADLSAELYTFVKPHASNQGEVIQCGAGDEAIGILYDLGIGAGAAGTMVSVAMPGGGALLKVAAVLAAGVRVQSDANGEGVANATTVFFGARVDAIGASSASGDYTPVIVAEGFAP